MTPFLGCVLTTMDAEKAQASKTSERKDREACAQYESTNMKFYNRQRESAGECIRNGNASNEEGGKESFLE